MSAQDNKSYLSAGINALSPWGSRSASPRPDPGRARADSGDTGLGTQRGGDHTVSHRHALSLKSYPRDCPPLSVQWFHAVDIPKRKPLPSGQMPPADTKPTQAPKKFSPFSEHDSRAIEAAFQRLVDEEDAAEHQHGSGPEAGGADITEQGQRSDNFPNATLAEDDDMVPGKVRVPVNEDFLFDVDIERRELAPAYWLGPVYDVRRGTWFYSEGSTLRPCDENLATQLEEGYLKVKAWRLARTGSQRSASQPRSRPISLRPGDDPTATGRPTTPTSDRAKDESIVTSVDGSPETTNRTHRLFGQHMGSVVTYEDGSTAWLMTDDFMSRMSSTVYQRFAGGAHFAGVKLIRGHSDASKKDPKDGKVPPSPTSATSKEGAEAASAKDKENVAKDAAEDKEKVQSPASETRRQTLERQMSSLVESIKPESREEQEEEVRKRDEQEIRDDYKDQSGEEQGREIEHLLLVTHGIGQRLGLRMESVNFVHDVNTLRKTLKAVYANSEDLQSLNNEMSKLPQNCRVQVLPICWRHLLDFPRQSLKHNRKEHDLGDSGFGEDEDYPNLDDITVEGVPAVRNLITDLALDILLYQSPAYKDHIARIVLEECNRIYRLFRERNPNFKGKVSLVGHSLGSAIMFDILCRQQDNKQQPYRSGPVRKRKDEHGLKLDFEVEDFYALGSPIGLFQMLKGRTIAARSPNVKPAQTPNEITSDPFFDQAPIPAAVTAADSLSRAASDILVSSPKCAQVFNIFHPTDPISYRIEPLISPAMSSLKPQPLPYTKKGFGTQVGQGLTGIGARVGQSVSGLWTSFSSGIASSLLNRSLGISAEDATKLNGPSTATAAQHTRVPSVPLSLGAGTNIMGGGVIPPHPIAAASSAASATTDLISASGAADDRKRKLAREGSQTSVAGEEGGEHPPTLIDGEIETLYSGFQKRRKSIQNDANLRDLGESPDLQEVEEREKRLRREEMKVRALNGNGRVDYSIQEGTFELSLIASIASHLSYWADEDVSHFMISQLLSRQRVLKRARSLPNLKA